MASRTPTAEGTRISALLFPVVAAAGCDLEQVSVTTVGRRSLVRVIVDTDGGVSLDGVADVSRAISDALDAAGYTGSAGTQSYTLEVSSPGVDRPLTEPRHWRRAAGHLVRTKDGDSALEGRVLSADDHTVAFDVAGQPRSVPYDRLGPGAVQVEFARKEGDN